MGAIKKAVQRFKKFHAKAPDKITSATIKIKAWPKALVYLGEAHALEYKSDKLAHGERKVQLYRHRTGKGVRFYTDPDGQMLLVFGGRFRVTDWLRD